MKILFAVLSALMLSATTAAALEAQTEVAAKDTVALVNGKPITAADFQERFDLTIYPHKEDVSALQAEKEHFLFSMIAEQLLADEGIKSGVLMTSDGSRIEREATRTFLRDALYRKEIMNKVRITKKDVAAGIKMADRGYTLDVYHFPDTSSAYAFYRECSEMAQAHLDSLLARIRIPHQNVHVVYGELVEGQERLVWGKPKGFMTMPVRGQNQFIVIRVVDVEPDRTFLSMPTSRQEAEVRRMIRKRRETALAEEFMYKLMGDVKATVDNRLMETLIDTVSAVLKEQSPSMFRHYCYLTPDETDELLRRLRAEDEVPMVTLRYSDDPAKDRSMSLGEIVNGLVPASFICRDTSRISVFAGLKFTIRHVIENELLAERAEQLGFQNSRAVRRDVAVVTNAYASQRIRNEVEDTVRLTSRDLDEFVQKYRASDLARVQLTLQRFHTGTLDEAVSVFNKIVETKGGKPEHPIQGIDVDTLTSNAYLLGDMGIFLARCKLGQVYGPVKTNDRYVMYRLLSRKSDVSDESITQSIDTIHYVALKEKRNRVLNRYVASLAIDGKVKVFLEVLKKVRVAPIQMFTVRNIGFGGRINAVPGLPVCEQWVKLAPMKEIIIP